MKRAASNTSGATTAKRRRGKTQIQYVPSDDLHIPDDPSTSTNDVRIWTVPATRNSSYRYRAARTTFTRPVTPPPVLNPDVLPLDSQASDDSEWQDMIDYTVNVEVLGGKRKQRNDSTKMKEWVSLFRQCCLDEMVRHDGLGNCAELGVCSSCMIKSGEFRCMECSGGLMVCDECMTMTHEQQPLHRVEVWHNGFFQRTELGHLGLVYHLGHHGALCPAPQNLCESFVVMDMNGVHHIKLIFCGCDKSAHLERYEQLLREKWYPATFQRPTTAFTFDLLDSYHKLTLQGKLNLYDFYHGILHKTDNYGRGSKIYRYHELSRCVRQWRHLKLLKRGGGAHNPKGAEATPEGSLAIECPACPHPGRNSPANLDELSAEKRWLHTLFLAIDANFRLKLKARGINDPELGSGWAYFVESQEYEKHVRKHFEEGEIKSCGSTFHAVNEANSKFSKGYAVTGVGAVVCARHNFVQKNGVGDLQRGERQCNIDYILLSTLKHEDQKDLKLSYDIACSWSKHLESRIATHYPVEMQLSDGTTIIYLIPKFHLPGHGLKCQTKYSFNFVRFVGRTHGETIEQEWSHINGAVLMTREMGPGARHAALDDHWGGWNWLKLLKLAEYLGSSLKKAFHMMKKHRVLADKHTATFPPATVAKWVAMVHEWDANKKRPDPYKEPEESISSAEVRRLLADEESQQLARGEYFPHKVTAAVFVRTGLEVEEQQRTLLAYIKRKTAETSIDKAALQEKRNTLRRQLEKWRDVQAVYMPGVASILGASSDPDARTSGINHEQPELTKLIMPSAIPASHRASACIHGVASKEQRLRLAQVSDALAELRRARRINRGVWAHFHVNVAGNGQRMITRTRTIINNSAHRIRRAFIRYNACRDALLKLNPGGDWMNQYKPLTEADNTGPGKDTNDLRGDGDFTQSWIWLVSRSSDDTAELVNDEFQTAMRVEWARTVARAERWEEDYELTLMEMARTRVFLENKAVVWMSRANDRVCSDDIARGLKAYAIKQAAISRHLASKFTAQWDSVLSKLAVTHTWPDPLDTSRPMTSSTPPPTAPSSAPGVASPSAVPPGHGVAAPPHALPPRMTLRSMGAGPSVEEDHSSDDEDGWNNDDGNSDDNVEEEPVDSYDSDTLDLDCS